MKLFYRPVILEAGHLGASPGWHMTAEALTWAVARRDVTTCVCVKRQGPVRAGDNRPPSAPLLWMTLFTHINNLVFFFWHPDHNGPSATAQSWTFGTYLSASDVTAADVGSEVMERKARSLYAVSLQGANLRDSNLFQPFNSQKRASLSGLDRFTGALSEHRGGMLGWAWERLKGEKSRRWFGFFIFLR